jgi:hypothetical protein
LSLQERIGLAYAALSSLSREEAEQVAATVVNPAGSPLPSVFNAMQDARHWASMASRDELKAHALAAYEQLNKADQMSFQRHVFEVAL